LKRLDKKFKQIGNTTRVFGGFSIIFSGDFCQLEPVCSNDSELLFSSLSSGLWDNSINVVIILDNDNASKKIQKGSTICPTSEIVCCLPVFIKLYVIRTEYVHQMSSYHLHFRIEFFIFGLSSFFLVLIFISVFIL
jgi:hypothetical protein